MRIITSILFFFNFQQFSICIAKFKIDTVSVAPNNGVALEKVAISRR